MSMKQNKSSAILCTTKFFWPSEWVTFYLITVLSDQTLMLLIIQSRNKNLATKWLLLAVWQPFLNTWSDGLNMCVIYLVLCNILSPASYVHHHILSYPVWTLRIGKNVRSTYMYFLPENRHFETFNNNFCKKII